MIPKTIHYCWFGGNEKNKEIISCIESWAKLCPDFNIIEWNESNFDYNNYPFASRMYEQKKWAFVADYARLKILDENGGFYLDTDMLLLKSLSPLSEYECVLGEEAPGTISAGMIGSTPNHPFIKKCREFYDTNPKSLNTIPVILTNLFNEYKINNSLENIHVYPPKTFYPFDSSHIKEYVGQDLGDEVIGVHLWNYSWGHPLNRFFKKIGIYNFGKKVTEKLGIKKILKKLLGFV